MIVNFSSKISMPTRTVAIKDTMDQITPVMESWFFSKIAGIQVVALIKSTMMNKAKTVQPGFRANFLDRNSPQAKKIAEIHIHAHEGKNVRACMRR
jgi:hypothetical protein